MVTVSNKSLYMAIFLLILLFASPIILYNGYYIDDNIRIITGNPDWSWVGRTFADYLMISLSLNEYIDDFSPIPLIIGIAIISFVIYYAVNNVFKNDIKLINIIPFIFIVVNPFFMQNLTYKFDSLPMLLALSSATLAFFIDIENTLKSIITKIALIFISLELYQPCANIFLMLGACNIIINIKDNKNISDIKEFLSIIFIYIIATLFYMLFEKIIHPDVVLSRGHIVPLQDFPITIKENIKELFKMVSFLVGKIGVVVFSLPILLYWGLNINKIAKQDISWINKVLYIVSPFIIFLFIWGPLLVIKEKISLPRELPTIGILLLLNSWILINGLRKIKLLSYIPYIFYISSVLLCSLFINTLKIQDSFNDMIYNNLYASITNNPNLYNVKEIKINGNVPINPTFSRKVKENPYFYTLTMATPEWVTRAILIRKGLKQVKISFDGNDKGILKKIVSEKVKPSVNNQNYIIYKYNNITYVWFK